MATMQSIQPGEAARPIKGFGFHKDNWGNEWKGALQLRTMQLLLNSVQ